MTKRELIEALKDVSDNAVIIIGAYGFPQLTGYYTDQIYYEEPFENERGRVIITNSFMDKVADDFRLIYEKD